MASFIVSGKKLEQAEMKINELDRENSKLKGELEKISRENQELKEQVENVLVSLDKKDLNKVKDDIMGKAKGALGDYVKSLKL